MSKICKVDGCHRKHNTRGYCGVHYKRMMRYGRTELLPNRLNKDGSLRNPDGAGHINDNGYMVRNGGRDREHILVVEKVLGKKLPKGVVIHHVDENRQNNNPNNLVVCPDSAYHNLIHKRQRAYEACGHVDWMKCLYCKQWDDTKNMYVKPSGHEAHHHKCRQQKRKELKK